MVETLANLAEQFMLLFPGLDTAHGVFFPERFEGKKHVGKASTVRQPVTKEVWLSHLAGKVGLGVIPIDAKSECMWACIDVDDYDIIWEDLLEKTKDTPLVVCRSKSGGAHLYLFLSEPVSARLVRDYLRTMVGSLGRGNSEIFPKQDIIHAERGDVGNWLNMPYFGEHRKCVVLDGGEIKELDASQFIFLAYNHKRIKKAEIIDTQQINYDESVIESGPPCLQAMSLVGFPEHTRNISLFNVGVYAKKAFPDKWQNYLKNLNHVLFKEKKLSEKEVDVILKSLAQKEYAYQCYEEPLCSFCNAKLCRTRKFGISNIVGLPIINSVTKVTGDLSMWFIDVEGGRLELTTEELYDNRRFIMRCLNDLNILPNRMTSEKWSVFVQELVDKSIEIRDEHMFERQQIPQLFRQFIIARLAKNMGDIDANRTIWDREEHEIRFKFDAFVNFIRFKRININRGALIMYFKSRGSRTSVAKDKLRRSIRFVALRVTDEEEISIDEKIKGDEVI